MESLLPLFHSLCALIIHAYDNPYFEHRFEKGQPPIKTEPDIPLAPIPVQVHCWKTRKTYLDMPSNNILTREIQAVVA